MNARRNAYPTPVRLGRYRYSKLRWRLLVGVLDAIGSMLTAPYRKFKKPSRVVDPRRIVVVQLDHLGDAVLSSPLFPRLKQIYPEAVIDVVASPSNHAVFEADPHVRRVHIAAKNWFERRRGGWALGSAVWNLGRKLRLYRYDLGIDVRGDVLTVLTLAIAGIPRRLGWAMGGGGFLLTDIAEWVPGRHEARARMALLSVLDRDRSPSERGRGGGESIKMLVHVSDRDRARIKRRLNLAWEADAESRSITDSMHNNLAIEESDERVGAESLSAPGSGAVKKRARGAGKLLVAHLGAGTGAKRWPIEHWRELIGRFLEDGWRVAIVGGATELEGGVSLDPHPSLIDWTATLTPSETTALLELADLFIGSDSGPAHLAAAAGVVSVILFSGTNRASQWRPWSRKSLVLRRPTPCGPCHQKNCPVFNHPCMSFISPDRVYRAAYRWSARIRDTESSHVSIG